MPDALRPTEPTAPAHRSFGAQAFHYFNRDHTKPPSGPVPSAAAWLGRDQQRLDSEWRIRFTPSEIEELDRRLDELDRANVATEQIHAGIAPLPQLGPRIQAWRHELSRGRGFVVLSGLPVERWGEERSGRAFWLLGHHLGVPGAQNAANELLGHVIDYREREDTPNVRLYRTAAHIGFHCDAADVVGLLCLETATRGGASRIASSVAVWNGLFEQDPTAASSLFEPWALDRRDEHPPDQPGHLAIQPCCLGQDGQLRTFYHSEYFRSAERLPEVGPLSSARRATLDRYDALAHSETFRLDMRLERGDIQFISNHSIIHARTEYEDTPERRRHLLRLWLSVEER